MVWRLLVIRHGHSSSAWLQSFPHDDDIESFFTCSPGMILGRYCSRALLFILPFARFRTKCSSICSALSRYSHFVCFPPNVSSLYSSPYHIAMSPPRVLIYLLRRDLRLADNPIFNEIYKTFQQSQQPYTYLLPVYVFAAQQIEVSGFLTSDTVRSPFPEARSNAAGFWRCGPHRAKFLAESVWDLKQSLSRVGNGLEIRVGMIGQVINDLLEAFKNKSSEVAAVWMTDEEGVEEKREERDVKRAAEDAGIAFKLWIDEKYYIDE